MSAEFMKVEVPIIDVDKAKTSIGEYEVTKGYIGTCDSCNEVAKGIIDKGYMYINKDDKKDMYLEVVYKCTECYKDHSVDQYL